MTTKLILFFLSFGVAYLIVGMLWYARFAFGKAWAKAAGVSDARLADKRRMYIRFSVSFLASIVTATALVYVLTPFAALLGLGIVGILLLTVGVWLSFMALPALVSQLYQERSWKLFFIDSGFHLVTLLVMALVWWAWSM